MQDNFEADVKLVSEEVFYELAHYYSFEDPPYKFVVCYLFDDRQGASFDFKALS